MKKYGKDESKHPEFDSDLWSRAAGGKNKGKLYGFSNVRDPLALLTNAPSTSCSSTTYAPRSQESQDSEVCYSLLIKVYSRVIARCAQLCDFGFFMSWKRSGRVFRSNGSDL